MGASAAAPGEPRRLRADAARNRQRLIDAAAEVLAARGLDATMDDIARHAGVNVATAYRNFSSKHELAREFIRQRLDQTVAIAEESAADPDPWQGLILFLRRTLKLMTSDRTLFDVTTHAYGTDHYGEFLRQTAPPLERLLARGQQARVVRADVTATDLAPILEMLLAITGDAHDRYLGLILAGLRPGQEPLSGKPPTVESLIQAASDRGGRAASVTALDRESADSPA